MGWKGARLAAMESRLSLIATCSLGLEELLAAELTQLGVAAPASERGAVRWRGDWASCWRANWRLRTANRVLVQLASWQASGGDSLAAGAQRLVESGASAPDRDWGGVSVHQLFDPARTFSIRATVSGSRMRDSRWVALKVKDGIVDGQRQVYGRRSSIDRDLPGLPLRVRLVGKHATLLLDTSGMPLDRRGYRLQMVGAPLREQLAAACVLAADWSGGGAIADPMCGSGTLLAEAGWIALGRAPGAMRWRQARDSGTFAWAFEGFPGFDAQRFAAVRSEAIPALMEEADLRLYAGDTESSALNATESNLRRAGLIERTWLRQTDAFTTDAPPGPGLVLINPPYGERLAMQPDHWKRIGDLLKQRWQGWRAVVVAGDAGKGKFIGLRPKRRLPIKNGPLDARILIFDLF